ncbi:dihydrofolate reductase family protein [Subtercola boreus]|uniref:Deaminase n=1 Tax=Subtercola boreus TaxID=120213 RepID=A0A3E0W6X1_9MICO|nr:dihydrofolate reductase family protein [Subtercola boreus]RFA18284.1 deaminase [Subtercola boreus]RFA18676.1 deaminase [Subtercola boreus]RFA25279.1 deaminase [Subtercola boreus]
MARLIYSSITSLDGYIEDESGSFAWSAPDEEVHAFVNDTQRTIGTHLYGRRLYETMRVWETMSLEGEPPVMVDYAALWRAAEKVVYSSTLTSVYSARTRIEPRFDTDAVAELKQEASADLVIGGPALAAQALAAGLVDEVQQFVSPVIVGGGKRFLPDGLRLALELKEQRPFANGVVFLRYRVPGPRG